MSAGIPHDQAADPGSFCLRLQLASGEVARVSITPGLLESIRETGVCILITTDLPTNTCKAWPSDCAEAGSAARKAIAPKAKKQALHWLSAGKISFGCDHEILVI